MMDCKGAGAPATNFAGKNQGKRPAMHISMHCATVRHGLTLRGGQVSRDEAFLHPATAVDERRSCGVGTAARAGSRTMIPYHHDDTGPGLGIMGKVEALQHAWWDWSWETEAKL